MAHPLWVRRKAYELLGEGRSVAAVAETLGVSMTSIKEWRGAVGGVMRQQPAESGRYLSRDERYEIARLREHGMGVRAIAARTGRSPSTISRELRRDVTVPRPGKYRVAAVGYQPEAAHNAALRARARPRPLRLEQEPGLYDLVQRWLNDKLSPEQIAGRLRVEFPDDESMRISHETIYRAIYVRPRGQLRRHLQADLRTGRTLRKPRATRTTRSRGAIQEAVSIHDRPAEVETRLVPGHYEGDLVVGPVGTPAAIATLVERTSGHITAFLIKRQTTEATINGLTAALTRTGWPMKTLTWDRGKEMAGHAAFTIDTNIQIYFADPHAPWQRGSNESANGLLRQYFPKGLDLGAVSNRELQHAVNQLNDRPRKRHGFLTPNEVLADILAREQATPGVATTA